MTDSNDPFAARPYVPPAERDAAAEHAPEPDASPREATPTSEPAVDQPTTEQPTASDSSTEPTVPVAPTPVEAESPAAAGGTAASAPDSTPAPDSYTHRYPPASEHPGAATGASAAATTPTETLPPFHENEPTASAASPLTPRDEPPAKTKKQRGRKIAAATAFLVLAAGAGYGGSWVQDQNGDGNSTTVSSLDTGKTSNTNAPAGAVEQVAQKVLPSVVQINVKGATESGSGTGIIISSDGQILTNNHVVEVAADKGSITVAFNDGTNAKASIVGRDPVTDLAVVKAEGKSGLTPAVLGTSADLKVGQEVVAIGSPFGLESTVTQGIISALNRPVTSSDGGSAPQGGVSPTFPAVQTDAAINPGNSGGPLVDLQGRVIAINSAIRSNGGSPSASGSIGLGFAIPIDLAKNVSKHLVKGEKVQHAKIGVTVSPAVSDDGITGIGAEVKEVTSGGAGDKAGLKKGDIITSLNGNLVSSSEALVASVRGFEPGQKVTITYMRNGQKDKADVTLQSDGGDLGS
ncbi:trypsin-like peptidase domain-containing protein [Aeromicrobium sp.]|uniref:trypsin-like peptidase domain-containing protein n=1 Tax=Aeromicrobium sp. TaxID=1871063 RepID=UPI0019BAC905|nr:trypsin-like peptidase domain-containing protein [Aeromicrobium sp.]MBC7631940.1 trypsin-like peptidase domain-containing protein [Aeromicrobium sp.]